MELVKAHAYGNDFLLLPSSDTAPSGDMASLARRVCDRHAGIGADGLMIVVETERGARTRFAECRREPVRDLREWDSVRGRMARSHQRS